ncbi:hypothetical protein FD967_01685 [Polynucleobacter sp. JS-Mosq-20-D10]|uniref:hypothetical protein n=1 Tax=Polynucleobacter sp. JS-Mosq-20-D10 TaxID=2576922 RepID=UPI001BFDCAE3|nr:hypothetical protein [Polynucleobacter sp. JS-Mosq-20-D10]QWE00781.1 hypothetical protein FD967_01685 [Polynucleobacter sp. JS-Mosq-20-D10]
MDTLFTYYKKIYNRSNSIYANIKLRAYKIYRIFYTHKSVNDLDQLEDIGFLHYGKIDIASYVNENIISPEPKIDFLPIYQKMPKEFIFYGIPHNNEFLIKSIFTDRLYKVLYGFFGKNFYIRGNIQYASYTDNFHNGTEDYHIDDGFTVNLMINLSDVHEDSMHMEFIGANFKCPSPPSDVLLFKDVLHRTYGGPGEAFLFTAGRNYHRRISGLRRDVLILNFVPISPISYFHNGADDRNQASLSFTKNNQTLSDFLYKSRTWNKNNFSFVLSNVRH